MPKRGKKYQEARKLFDRQELYDADAALDLVVKAAPAKFDETVEVHIKLGVDGRHADQQVRGAIVLPNGTGKTKKVLVFAKGPKLKKQELILSEQKKWQKKSKTKTGSILMLSSLLLT